MSRKNQKIQDSDTLAFAKSINKLIQKQEDFQKMIDELNTFKVETLTNIQLEFDSKRKELDALNKEYDTLKKDLQIKADQEFKEYGYVKAVEILEENDEIAVNEVEYNELQTSIETIKEEMEEETTKQIKDEKINASKELAMVKKTMQLEHKAEIAMLSATVDQLTKERQTFESTIDSLKSEIAAQRDLTRQVAEASKQGAISQQFGK